MSPSLLLLLLLLLLGSSSSTSSSARRVSSSTNSPERRLVRFSHPDLHHVTALLLSDDGATLYVGAQDAVLSLDVSARDVISLKHKVQWRPTEQQVHDCGVKGKNSTVDCPNFVGVLLQINHTHLYACGSHAYSPREVYVDLDSFSLGPEGSAKGRCPSNPFERSTAAAIGGELFTATTTDFRGVKPHIARFFSTGGRPDVTQESSGLLEEPVFVSSAWVQTKLYFFFSEVGTEFVFEDEIRIPRVAQVCKDDVGGQRTLQKKWTSFAKSSLLCQSPKSLPYSTLQDVFTLPPAEGADATDALFYGVFTSQWSAAVCVFSLQQLQSVFSSSYRTLDKKTSQWTQQAGQQRLGQCGLDAAADSELEVVRDSFLTSGAVRPVRGGPVLVSTERYSRVVAMTTRGANGREYKVLFLLTEAGFLHKVVLFQGGAHVVEEIRVFTEPQLFYNLLLSRSKDVVYVGTSGGVTAVPVVCCSVHTSCLQCVLTRDPQCGWSRSRRTCGDSGRDTVQVLEDGSVEEACRDQAGPASEVRVHLNDLVTLPCQKTPNMAALTWTSSRFSVLPQKLFLQSTDDLRFFASAETLGSYRCHAQVGDYQEVVASYDVQQVAPPRSLTPSLNDDTTDEPIDMLGADDESPAGDTSPPPGADVVEQQGAPCSQSSLVVVSLLLAVCVCVLMLAALHTWCRRSGRPKWSTRDDSESRGPN